MRNLLIPVILLALGVVGLGMIGRGRRMPRMDAAADKTPGKTDAIERIVRQAKERVAALLKERRETIERYHARIDALKREKIDRDITAL